MEIKLCAKINARTTQKVAQALHRPIGFQEFEPPDYDAIGTQS